MAFKFPSSSDTFDVIFSKDDAIDTSIVTEEVWESYKKDYDESKLKFLFGNEPTRFVMKRCLPYKAQQRVANEQLGVSEDGKPEFKLGYTLEEVRCSLVDIKNPASLPEESKVIFKKDSDGFASKELIAMLNNAGVVAELLAARQTMAANTTPKK